MEIRVLKYFLLVAREENITRAANLLHLTQPTLSRQLMQLEEELGVKLFDRGRHSVRLTEDGLRLKQRAQEIVGLADKTLAEFTQGGDALAGEICIGCGETKNMSFLSEQMRAFRALHPLVSFNIYSATADDVKERMARGLVDIGLLTEPVDLAKYDFYRMPQKEAWSALISKASPLYDKAAITAEDLVSQPVLLPMRDSVRHELASWFGDVYDELEVAASYNLIVNAANMVRHGMGIAFCFDMDFHYDDLRFIPLSPALETGAVLVWKKNQLFSAEVRAFLEFLRNSIQASQTV